MNPSASESGEPEQVYPQTPVSPHVEAQLSGAYRRILRTTVILSAGSTIAAFFVSWPSGLGVIVGSLTALVNFLWLHHGTEKLVDRMLASSQSTPVSAPANSQNEASPLDNPAQSEPPPPSSSRLRFSFPFPLRYLLIIAVAYVILKSYPQLLIGFLIGMFLPVLASMGEGIYEAVAIGKN